MKHKNPAATSDLILENENEEIYLIQRKDEPFKGMWAIPGGHVELGKETCKQAAVREFREETGLIVKVKDLKLFNEYSEPDRDPRGHYITHVYTAKKFTGALKAGDDAKEVKPFSKYNLPPLAFDHKKIIKDYLMKKKYGVQ